MRSWRCLGWGPGFTKSLDTGERGAAPGWQHRPRRGYKALAKSSSNYISDTRSHKQTPDTSCLFSDWKSLFYQHRWWGWSPQSTHAQHPQRGSANSPPRTFCHLFALHGGKGWERISELQQRGPQEALLTPLPRVCTAPVCLACCGDQPWALCWAHQSQCSATLIQKLKENNIASWELLLKTPQLFCIAFLIIIAVTKLVHKSWHPASSFSNWTNHLDQIIYLMNSAFSLQRASK